MTIENEKIRLDQWLWAARFFKTRKLCQQAINGGKVHLKQQRCKPGRTVQVGMQFTLRQGYDLKTIEVLALNKQRGNAQKAALLYRETDASINARNIAANKRKLDSLSTPQILEKPTKQQRRVSEIIKRDWQ